MTTRNRVGARYKVAGGALRMPGTTFLEELGRKGAFEGIVHRYAEAFFAQVTQSTACNVLHTIEQRLCRWILILHDRLAGDSIQLTQAQLANTLGVRRSGVNVAAVSLQNAGLIGYTRGVVGVLDRRGLEARSCECYGEVRIEFERLLR